MKTSVSHQSILEDIRGQIVAGKLSPGSQLPTRTEIERHFQASSVTVQRALSSLAEDGFVHPRGRHGTYVSEHPPHLSHYGLVFRNREAHPGAWVHFWTALSREAQRLSEGESWRLSAYYGIEHAADLAHYHRLVADVESHRLAGLIFADPPHYLKGSAPLEHPGLPRVAIMREGAVPGIQAVQLDNDSFMRKALQRLASRGRRQIALLVAGSSPGAAGRSLECFLPEFAAARMNTRPYWTQSVHPSTPGWARNCTELLLQGPASGRPDGLIIADDNLVEHATAGILDIGLRVPEDLDVVAHCNFPWSTPSLVPACRLGFDAGVILLACLQSIDRQRRGESLPSSVTLPAVFEDEATALSGLSHPGSGRDLQNRLLDAGAAT